MNYEDMSDFEINKLVARAFLPCDYLFDDTSKRVELAGYKDVMVGGIHDQVLTPYQEFNPCNNPSDAWAIIVENKIGTQFFGDKWMSFIHNVTSRHFTYDKNPLRAAMICFLKMKDA